VKGLTVECGRPVGRNLIGVCDRHLVELREATA
jgi:hypothetical protein